MERKPQCEEIWDALSANVDGCATAAEAAAAESHLRNCRRCAADHRLMQRIASVLPKSAQPIPPHGLRESILRTTVLRVGWRARLANPFTASPGQLRVPNLVFAGAAALLLMVVFVTNSQVPQELTPDRQSQPSQVASRFNRDSPAAPQPSVQALEPGQSSRLDIPSRIASTATLTTNATTTLFGSAFAARSMESALPPSQGLRFPRSATRQPSAMDPPDSDKPVVGATEVDANPRIDRAVFDPPASPESTHEPLRIARAEDRPLPPPAREVTEMQASAGSGPPNAYTMEAKGSLDPGAVASLADLKRTLQKDAEEESLPGAAFRMNDRREVRLAVHTSRF